MKPFTEMKSETMTSSAWAAFNKMNTPEAEHAGTTINYLHYRASYPHTLQHQIRSLQDQSSIPPNFYSSQPGPSVPIVNSAWPTGYPGMRISSSPFPQNSYPVSRSTLVITNSEFKHEQQDLSGISFKNEVCLGLPSNVTWDELQNEVPTDPSYLRYLLDLTRTLNREYRRKRRTNKIQTTAKSIKFTAPTISKSKEKSSMKKIIPVESVKTKKIEDALKISENEKPSNCSVKNQTTENKKQKKISVSELLQLWNTASDNPEIIKSVKRIQAFDKYLIRKKQFEGNNKEQSCGTSKEIDEESCDISINPNPVNHVNKNDEESKLKRLMNKSWLSIEDDVENNSKEIFHELNALLSELKTEKAEMQTVSVIDNGNDQRNSKCVESNHNEITSLVKEYKKPKKKKKIRDPETTKETQAKTDDENLPFDDYYDEERIEKGIQDGTMFKEILRINTRNTKEAYINCSLDSKDIFIDGIKDRNRALDGDEVVVELYSEDKWKWYPDKTHQKCGKVVAITSQNHPRTAVGYLKLVYGKFSGIILWPRDNRLPRIRIAENTCPLKYKAQHQRFKNILFLAKIMSWKSVKSAEGIVLQNLGDENSIDVESDCILLENNLNMQSFQNEAELSALCSEIPETELKSREDIRKQCVFTIDPPLAKDLDDALSWRSLPNGNVEVGVHIADVTHYLLINTLLDEDAQKKATSVYLVDKVYHMLPSKLCEICSLLPGSDKLAFSLFVELNECADIVSHRFSKTILRSCAQLTYDHAQEVIDKLNQSINTNIFPAITNGYSVGDCANVIWQLYTLSAKMRERRFSQGALRIDQPKIIFKLNESKLPISYTLYEGKSSNWLVEEFMLLANILAANKIKEAFPVTSLLRYHAAPKEKSLTTVVEYLRTVDIHINTNSAGDIYKSMMVYASSDEIGSARMAVIMHLLVKPMMRASYTCSASNIDNCCEFWHYALNTPLYTHFTSPIRRYADVVVHRLLASAIGHSETPNWTADDIQKIATNCNVKKNAAKKASETSMELFLRLYMEKNGAKKSRAVVIDVREKFFDVIDLSTRCVGRIYVDKIKDTESVDFSSETGISTLKIQWKGINNLLHIHIFAIVDVEVSYKKTNDKYHNNSLNYTLIKVTNSTN